MLSETPLGDLMVRAGLNGSLSLSSRWIEQREDDKPSEMMDARGREIFQSICHPQFLSYPQETGADVMVDTVVLLSPRVFVCVRFMHASGVRYLRLSRGRSGEWEGYEFVCFLSVWWRSASLRCMTVRVCVCVCVCARVSGVCVRVCCAEVK